ncbi:MAG: minor capsid protein [Chlorobiaceae bacterium]|nr:minor capsid protein [Chlorobiaceae bacterium]
MKGSLEAFLVDYLARKGREAANQVVALYDRMTKADDSRAATIIASIRLDWVDIVPEVAEYLLEISREGVRAAAVQLELTDAGITELAFTRAEAWARHRAAELVGMKWIGSELVENMDPLWSITESTRDMIRADVIRALDEGWSNQKLPQAIRENIGFSQGRAEMIARTETAFADVQGNRAFYEEAEPLVGPITWMWVTAGDDKVSDMCRMNQGAVRPVGGQFPSGATEPPQHPRCRCDVLPILRE